MGTFKKEVPLVAGEIDRCEKETRSPGQKHSGAPEQLSSYREICDLGK